jgi:hypothetical protein
VTSISLLAPSHQVISSVAATDIALVATESCVVLPNLGRRARHGKSEKFHYEFSGLDPTSGKRISQAALALRHRPKLVVWMASSPIFLPWQLCKRWLAPVAVVLSHFVFSSLRALGPDAHSRMVFGVSLTAAARAEATSLKAPG